VAAEFVALAELLRAPVARAEVAGAVEAVEGAQSRVAVAPLTRATTENAVRPDDANASEAFDDGRAAVVTALRDARLFRARLADAFDDAAGRLLRELASDVLARELRLAPCDLGAIVRWIGERAPVVRVRVAACDAAALAAVPLPRGFDAAVVADPMLAGGDAVVELGGGALDARLGIRLGVVLEAFA
jgi:hypothetical protein